MSKLNHYGIRRKVNEWFKSYLTNKKQCVSINGFKSDDIYEIWCHTKGPYLVIYYF